MTQETPASNETQDEITYWNPERDDDQPRSIRGVLIEYKKYDTDYGELLTMRLRDFDDSGIIWSRKVTGASLQRLVAQERPLPGEQLELTYKGMGEVKGGKFAGKPFHIWKLEVLGRAPEVPDFDALLDGRVEMTSGERPDPLAAISDDADMPFDLP